MVLVGREERPGLAGARWRKASKAYILFSTFRFPAVSRAFDASFGRFVRTTEAAIVRGASDVSSSSGILSLGESDMMERGEVSLE